jgi:hypothetical protein
MSDQTPVVSSPEPTGKHFSTSALVSTLTGAFTYVIYLLALIFDFSVLWPIILAPISAIAAIISGHKGKREIRQSDSAMSGKKLANAGLAMGYIYIALCIILIILLIMGASWVVKALGNLSL